MTFSFVTASSLACLIVGTLAAQDAVKGTSMMPATDAKKTVPSLVALVGRQNSELADVVERYSTDRGALTRRYDAAGSPDQRKRMRDFYQAWSARLREVDFAKLGLEGRIDYILLGDRLGHELQLLDRDEKLIAETATLVPFADQVLALQDARRRLTAMDPAAAARSLAHVADRADSLRKLFEGTPRKNGSDSASGPPSPQAPQVTKIVAYHAVQQLEQVRTTLGTWFKYYDGYDPMFSWWSKDPYKRADEALKKYGKTLREKIVGWKEGDDEPIVGVPIGADGLKADLAFEMIPYTPEQLIGIAEREYAWSEAEMKKASREMGFGDDWKQALEKVKNSFVEPGKQPDLIRDLAKQAEAFLDAHDYVTVPPLAREVWRMEMMSPERQKVSPFFLGGEVILVSYPTDAMSEDDKMMSMRGNNPHFSHATVFHELIPGHHLQQFMNARYNPHRRAFATPFWNEGQSLYWEMFLWDQGFHKSPEDRVGALFWRMHRSARIIFSLRYHLGTMTPQEAVDFLVEKVGFERANAEGEVRRSFNGSYAPLYQIGYMIGGLQIRALHKELVESGKMTNRQFHDAILEGGPMPIEMVRARLMKQTLPRDYVPQWKFAGPL
ncbi:MAG: DUF885 domain-containing protein [Gemmatimonadota bacterium]|nr:DUF885 domain-containing protein [Gemmatimonadota bacterium]